MFANGADHQWTATDENFVRKTTEGFVRWSSEAGRPWAMQDMNQWVGCRISATRVVWGVGGGGGVGCKEPVIMDFRPHSVYVYGVQVYYAQSAYQVSKHRGIEGCEVLLQNRCGLEF